MSYYFRRFGMQESFDYYQLCQRTQRNRGLYTADQLIRRNDKVCYLFFYLCQMLSLIPISEEPDKTLMETGTALNAQVSSVYLDITLLLRLTSSII